MENSHSNENRIALIYCRVSSERQKNEGHGLDSQEHRCRQFAQTRGYKVEDVFRDSFTGGGDFMRRPGMVELLRHVDKNAHKNYVVIFDDLSRFARDVAAHLRLRQEFDRRSIKIECPNFTFEDTPEGELIENIMAAQNQYHRKSNRRQVIQKQKARLEKGYWPFYPPSGYIQARHPMHGKLLAPIEPEASLIREAFEGFATGRFHTQADVLKFFRDSGFGRNLYQEGVRRILRRVIYAGYVERSEWGVSRRKAQHEPIISFEIYEKVQAKLDGKYKVRVRKDDRLEFALRGFVLCEFCQCPMTASWSKGRSKMYRYFRCKTATCVNYNGHIRADFIDEEFEKLLRSVVPNEEILNLAKAIILDVWQRKIGQMEEQTERLQRILAETRARVDKLSARIGKTLDERMIRIYEEQILKAQEEADLVQEKLGSVGISSIAFETALEAVCGMLKNPMSMWAKQDMNAKRLVLRLVFADKLAFHPKFGFGTAPKSIVLGLFEQIATNKSQDVDIGRNILNNLQEYLVRFWQYYQSSQNIQRALANIR